MPQMTVQEAVACLHSGQSIRILKNPQSRVFAALTKGRRHSRKMPNGERPHEPAHRSEPCKRDQGKLSVKSRLCCDRCARSETSSQSRSFFHGKTTIVDSTSKKIRVGERYRKPKELQSTPQSKVSKARYCTKENQKVFFGQTIEKIGLSTGCRNSVNRWTFLPHPCAVTSAHIPQSPPADSAPFPLSNSVVNYGKHKERIREIASQKPSVYKTEFSYTRPSIGLRMTTISPMFPQYPAALDDAIPITQNSRMLPSCPAPGESRNNLQFALGTGSENYNTSRAGPGITESMPAISHQVYPMSGQDQPLLLSKEVSHQPSNATKVVPSSYIEGAASPESFSPTRKEPFALPTFGRASARDVSSTSHFFEPPHFRELPSVDCGESTEEPDIERNATSIEPSVIGRSSATRRGMLGPDPDDWSFSESPTSVRNNPESPNTPAPATAKNQTTNVAQSCFSTTLTSSILPGLCTHDTASDVMNNPQNTGSAVETLTSDCEQPFYAELPQRLKQLSWIILLSRSVLRRSQTKNIMGVKKRRSSLQPSFLSSSTMTETEDGDTRDKGAARASSSAPASFVDLKALFPNKFKRTAPLQRKMLDGNHPHMVLNPIPEKSGASESEVPFREVTNFLDESAANRLSQLEKSVVSKEERVLDLENLLRQAMCRLAEIEARAEEAEELRKKYAKLTALLAHTQRRAAEICVSNAKLERENELVSSINNSLVLDIDRDHRARALAAHEFRIFCKGLDSFLTELMAHQSTDALESDDQSKKTLYDMVINKLEVAMTTPS